MTSACKVASLFKEAAIKTRTLGTCAICDRVIKTPGGFLAHHGYMRPGFGYITGSCPGTKLPPFEVSPKTAQVGLEYASNSFKRFTELLQELPTATVIPVRHLRHFGGKMVMTKQEEVPEREWAQYKAAAKRSWEYELKQATKAKTHFEKLVREWKPAEVPTVDEAETVKAERAEKVRQTRLDRYNQNLTKAVDRAKKTFTKLERMESGLRSERKSPKKIVKYLQGSGSAASILYQILGSTVDKLRDNYPLDVSRAKVIADMKLDHIWQHMGAVKSGGYITAREASDLELHAREANYGFFLSKGLGGWKPFWPGFKGPIHYPEGTEKTPTNIRDL